MNVAGRRAYWEARATDYADAVAAVGYCVDGVPVTTEFLDAIASEVIDKLALSPQVSLLEVGCGAGLLGARLAPHVRSYAGSDFSHGMVVKARALVPSARGLFVSEAGAVPVADGAFDRVLCYSVFLEFPDSDYVVRATHELLRVCKRGGLVLIGDLPLLDAGSVPMRTKRLQFAADFFERLDLGVPVEVLPQTAPIKTRVNRRFDVRFRRDLLRPE